MRDNYHDVLEMVVEYSRNYIVSNEQQLVSVFLCLITAFSGKPTEYVPAFIVGELSGGKTHLQRTAHKLIPDKYVHTITSGSDKAPIYSSGLRENKELRIIKFGEYNKLSKPILEFLKALSGDDDKFVYEVTKQFETEIIEHEKYVYTVTYAQVDIDGELESRVFVIPIMENYNINKAVAAIKLGAKEVDYMGKTYKMTTDEQLENSIMEAVDSMMSLDTTVDIPYTYALIDIVNHSKSVSKRHANLIASLIKASCRLNWLNRDTNDQGELVANAQDVANILSLFDLLTATFMAIDIIDTNIYTRLKSHTDQSEEKLIEYLQTVGLAELTKTELTRRLDKLYDENYITRASSSSGFLYSANSRKKTLDLVVDWKKIYVCDSKPVVDILTGKIYNSIIEFGKVLEREHMLQVSENTSSDIVETDDDIIVNTILNLLCEPDSNKTRSGIANKIPNEPHICELGKKLTFFDVVEILDSLTKQGKIEYNNEMYRIV